MTRELSPESLVGGGGHGGVGGHGGAGGHGHGATTRNSKKRKRVSWNDDVTEIPPLTEADYMKPRYGHLMTTTIVQRLRDRDVTQVLTLLALLVQRTNADADCATASQPRYLADCLAQASGNWRLKHRRSSFTCFTRTNAHILTQIFSRSCRGIGGRNTGEAAESGHGTARGLLTLLPHRAAGTCFTRFTSTKLHEQKYKY